MRGGSDPNFRGFMIQGRVVADDSSTGIFAASGTNYRGECSNVSPCVCVQDNSVVLFIPIDCCYTY